MAVPAAPRKSAKPSSGAEKRQLFGDDDEADVLAPYRAFIDEWRRRGWHKGRGAGDPLTLAQRTFASFIAPDRGGAAAYGEGRDSLVAGLDAEHSRVTGALRDALNNMTDGGDKRVVQRAASSRPEARAAGIVARVLDQPLATMQLRAKERAAWEDAGYESEEKERKPRSDSFAVVKYKDGTATIERSKWYEIKDQLWWVFDQPNHPRMADKKYLACKFFLDALHDAQVQCACRKKGCLCGNQCAMCLHHGVTDALAAMLCDPKDYDCANGNCKKCGWENFKASQICPKLFKEKKATVNVWKVGQKELRNGYMVDEVQSETLTMPEFLEELEEEMKAYAVHHQAAEHALSEFEECRKWLPPGIKIVVWDDAPKFHHEPKQGYQDQKYQQAQTCTKSGYVHWRDKKAEPLKTEIHHIFSQDASQDGGHLHAARLYSKGSKGQLHTEKGVYRGCKGVIEFFDGAFKGKPAFRVLSDLPSRLSPSMEFVMMNFFAAGRGRGPWDTASGLLCKALRKEINRTGPHCAMTIPDARSAAKWAAEHLTEMPFARDDAEYPISARHYWYMSTEWIDKVRADLDDEFDADELKGLPRTRDIMCVPALQTPEGYLFESNAIARYVARLGDAKGANLLGHTSFESAQVDMWVDFANNELRRRAQRSHPSMAQS
eukprot:gene55035-12086_t